MLKKQPNYKYPCYSSWNSMRNRCNNTNNHNYKNYGGRGIAVCERWASFTNFLEDMGERPEGHTLDRIDNDGDYTPENCRWATPKEQSANRKNTTKIIYKGKDRVLAELLREKGVHPSTYRGRVRRGRVAEEAINAKKGKNKGNGFKERESCGRGHIYTEETTYLRKGIRHCKTCVNIRTKAYRKRKKEKEKIK